MSSNPKEIAPIPPSRAILGAEDVQQWHAELLRFRRESLRQAQRALELAQFLEKLPIATTEPTGRE